MKKISFVVGGIAVAALLSVSGLVGCSLLTGAITLTYNGNGSNVPYNGSVTVSSSPATFTINNSGANTLNITGNVSWSQDSLGISLIDQPAGSVAAGSTTTFTVHFSGTSGSALISIPNDSLQSPFNFTMKK